MTPDYSLHNPKGWCGDPSRGAALGRPTIHEEDEEYTGRISLQLVRLNNGGYDKNGTYFGIGEPLYWYANNDGTIDGCMRANNRSMARMKVLELFPKAKIRK